jgi:hypothetical protein
MDGRLGADHMTYDIHPVANLFPMIEGEALDKLVADIKTNGLLVPIAYQGNSILDGRNRLRACQIAGVVPQYQEIPSSVNAMAYIISHNLHRRHLTTAQRAAIAAELATMERGGDRKSEKIKGSNDPSVADTMSIDQAADLMSVSAPSVKRAKARMKENPAAHEAAKRGEKTKKPEGNAVGRTYRTIRTTAIKEYARLTGRIMGKGWIDYSNLKDVILENAEWARAHNWAKEITEDQAKDIRAIVGDFVDRQAQDSDDVMAPKESIHSRIDAAKIEADESRKDVDVTEKTKLERAIKAHQRLMDLQFEQRVKEHMDEILKLYAEEYDRYKAFNDAYSGVFSDDEYRLLISVLHPDRCPPERAQQFAKAFHLIKSKEEVLCKVKQADRPNAMPSTIEELMARRRKH